MGSGKAWSRGSNYLVRTLNLTVQPIFEQGDKVGPKVDSDVPHQQALHLWDS